MFNSLAVFVFSFLFATSLFAYAEAPPQPQMIGQYNIGELPHIGTLVCLADNIQVAVYGDVQTLAAVVIFHNNTAVFSGVVENRTEHQPFVVNEAGDWEQTTGKAILESPLIETLGKVQICKEKMGLS